MSNYPTKNIELYALEEQIRNLKAELSQEQATTQRLKAEVMELSEERDRLKAATKDDDLSAEYQTYEELVDAELNRLRNLVESWKGANSVAAADLDVAKAEIEQLKRDKAFMASNDYIHHLHV